MPTTVLARITLEFARYFIKLTVSNVLRLTYASTGLAARFLVMNECVGT